MKKYLICIIKSIFFQIMKKIFDLGNQKYIFSNNEKIFNSYNQSINIFDLYNEKYIFLSNEKLCSVKSL